MHFFLVAITHQKLCTQHSSEPGGAAASIRFVNRLSNPLKIIMPPKSATKVASKTPRGTDNKNAFSASSSSSMKTTKDDKKLAAALAIRTIAKNLQKFNTILDDAIAILSKPEDFSKARKGTAERAMKQLKVEINFQSQQLLTEVKVLDPIPKLNYVHGRSKSPLSDATNKRPSPTSVSAPKPKRTKATIPTQAVQLPLPINGTQFSKLEVVQILEKANDIKEHTKLLDAIVKSQLVPVKRRNINTLMQNYRAHGMHLKGLHRDWGSTGRNPLLSNNDVTDMVAQLQSQPGRCMEKEDIRAAIKDKVKKNMEARGILSDFEPSEGTVENYRSLAAAQPNVSISKSSITKSKTRFTAENSLRSAMSFVLAVAATHFVLSTEPNPDVLRDSKSKTAISEGSKFLFGELTRANKNRP